MKIISSRPPNFAAIAAVFSGAYGQGVIFAYAPNIYAPNNTGLPPEIIAHETAHIKRQLEIGVEAWWDRYLTDAAFRFDEELIAHRAEYRHLCDNATSRNVRRSALKHVAKKLAAPLYGRMVTMKQAMEAITV